MTNYETGDGGGLSDPTDSVNTVSNKSGFPYAGVLYPDEMALVMAMVRDGEWDGTNPEGYVDALLADWAAGNIGDHEQYTDTLVAAIAIRNCRELVIARLALAALTAPDDTDVITINRSYGSYTHRPGRAVGRELAPHTRESLIRSLGESGLLPASAGEAQRRLEQLFRSSDIEQNILARICYLIMLDAARGRRAAEIVQRIRPVGLPGGQQKY